MTSRRSLCFPFSAIIMPRLDDVEPPSTPICSNGVPGVEGVDRDGTIGCCPLGVCKNSEGVEECGGTECGQREGRAKNCCISVILDDGNKCSEKESAPCIVGECLPKWLVLPAVDIHPGRTVIHPGRTVVLELSIATRLVPTSGIQSVSGPVERVASCTPTRLLRFGRGHLADSAMFSKKLSCRP